MGAARTCKGAGIDASHCRCLLCLRPRRSSWLSDNRMTDRKDHCAGSRLISLCVGALGWTLVSAHPIPCNLKSAVAGSCFTVHGRLRLYDGTPSIRIWRIGTHRLLAVTEGRGFNNENPGLPPPLDVGLDWDTVYIGDYRVCPLEPDKPGTMRIVCVQAVAHVVRRHLSGDTGAQAHRQIP